jgi:hypothetical protein
MSCSCAFHLSLCAPDAFQNWVWTLPDSAILKSKLIKNKKVSKIVGKHMYTMAVIEQEVNKIM